MANKFGEFVGMLIVVSVLALCLALSIGISYFVLTWAFGMR